MSPYPTWPTFAKELLEARARLTLGDEVGLALRSHRRRLRLSQRAYAAMRGYSRATLGRMESAAGAHRLDDVVRALDGTGFALYLGREAGPPSAGGVGLEPGASARPLTPAPRAVAAEGAPGPVPAEVWPRTELIARVRGRTRRFPGHLEATQVMSPPQWWWVHEFFSGPTEEPLWYSPRPWVMAGGSVVYPLERAPEDCPRQADDGSESADAA